MKALTKPCLQCGRIFQKHWAKSVKQWNERTKVCSIACRGKYVTSQPSWIKKQSESHRGQRRPHTKETKEKIRKALWRGGKPKCLICDKQLSVYGAKHCKAHRPITLATRRKRSESTKGEKSHSWQGGLTSVNGRIRGSLEMKLWREAVMKRDNYTCVRCGQRGGNLEADHIKQFAYYSKLRFKVSNGRTLCVGCHRKTKTHSNKQKSHS